MSGTRAAVLAVGPPAVLGIACGFAGERAGALAAVALIATMAVATAYTAWCGFRAVPGFAAGYVLAALLLAPDATAPAGSSGIDSSEPGDTLLFGLPLLLVILAGAALVGRLARSLRKPPPGSDQS